MAELNFIPDAAETLGIVQPIIVWHGAEDEMNSAEDVRRMLEGVPIEEFHVAKGQGHMVLFGRFRDILARLVNDDH